MELSMSTIVIVVLAMSMLILGIILVKNIFSGTSDNISTINDDVKDQINQLFAEDSRIAVYLSNQIAEIEQNEDWGVAFAIKNLQAGTADAGEFTYEVSVSDPDVEQNCGIGESTAQSWIKTGRTDTVTIAPGETYYGIARFLIPENSPLCTVRFHIDVTLDGKAYASDFFDVEVTA